MGKTVYQILILAIVGGLLVCGFIFLPKQDAPSQDNQVTSVYGDSAEIKLENASDDWTISVPLMSVNSGIILSKEAWMKDSQFYYKQILDLNVEQNKIQWETAHSWSPIVDSDALLKKEIARIHSEIQDLELTVEDYLRKKDGKRLMLSSLVGDKLDFNGKQYSGAIVQSLKRNWEETAGVLDVLVFLKEKEKMIKSVTIQSLQGRDAFAAGASTRDEKVVSLFLSWHLEAFDDLLKEQDVLFSELENGQ